MPQEATTLDTAPDGRTGTAHWNVRNTPEQIMHAKQLIADAPKKEILAYGQRQKIADAAGVSAKTVDKILAGKAWNHIPNPQPQSQPTERPNASLIAWAYDLSDEGDVVWRGTNAPAEVSDVFTQERICIFCFYTLHAHDVAHVIRTGEWPDGASDIPDPSIRRVELNAQHKAMRDQWALQNQHG